jgi:hypothetical protein
VKRTILGQKSEDYQQALEIDTLVWAPCEKTPESERTAYLNIKTSLTLNKNRGAKAEAQGLISMDSSDLSLSSRNIHPVFYNMFWKKC